MLPPGANTSQPLGTMDPMLDNATTDFVWQLTVIGSQLRKAGSYNFSVIQSTNASAVIVNTPLRIQVYPAASAADTSTHSVAMPELAAVGAVLSYTLYLNDIYGEPSITAANASLVIIGGVTGTMNATAQNFTTVAPGIFSYNYTLAAIERLNFTMFISGSKVGRSAYLNVTTVLPSVIDAAATANNAMVQQYGEITRRAWNASGAALPVSDDAWHLMYLPVIRVGGSPLYSNPQLAARLVLTPNGTTEQMVFNGYWSSSNGSYLMPFKLPDNITYIGQVELRQSSNSTLTIVTKAVSFAAFHSYPAAATSLFRLAASSPTIKMGETVYIVAGLRAANNQPALAIDTVVVQATGSLSGIMSVGPLTQQTDGTWATQLHPVQQETITVTMTVGGTMAGPAQTMTITGRSPTYLDYNSSIQHPKLLAQSLSQTSYVSAGASYTVYIGETSLLYIPVFDRAGTT
eukprot:GHRR01037155.1.p1 GENE.GHRR01037155.1~~GHRR01037155.1.p1  ORF type:complete len:461 (+),score=119.60 GHRR01037155.1:1820-3202(+)